MPAKEEGSRDYVPTIQLTEWGTGRSVAVEEATILAVEAVYPTEASAHVPAKSAYVLAIRTCDHMDVRHYSPLGDPTDPRLLTASGVLQVFKERVGHELRSRL